MQREKGKAYERHVARMIRERVPAIASRTHRAIQSRGPDASDVIAPGLWVECQDARDVTPLAKLEQAERDAGKAGSADLRVAVTHVLRARSSQVTLRLSSLLTLCGFEEAVACATVVHEFMSITVTIDLVDFLNLYADSEALEKALARMLADEADIGQRRAEAWEPD
jgi:hypothetical protein